MSGLDHLSMRLNRLVRGIGERWRDLEDARHLLARQWRRTRARPITWMTAYAALAVAISYPLLDRPIAQWCKAHVTGEIEGFWKTVTHLGLGGVWMVPSGLILLGIWLAWRAAPTLEIRERLGRAAWAPGFFFAALAVSGLLNTAIKILVGRTRPKLLFEQGLYDFAPLTHAYATNSFPSGHAEAAFAAMTALALILPRYDAAFMAIALLVAASRVATSVHFLSDAVAGAWLGTVVTVLLYRMLAKRGIDVRLRFERDNKLSH